MDEKLSDYGFEEHPKTFMFRLKNNRFYRKGKQSEIQEFEQERVGERFEG